MRRGTATTLQKSRRQANINLEPIPIFDVHSIL